MEDILNQEQTQLRAANVKHNQDLEKRIINWILCIGRQGIAYRGSFESTKNFGDVSLNHGNLLEILRTASLNDEKLKIHFEKVTGRVQEEEDRG